MYKKMLYLLASFFLISPVSAQKTQPQCLSSHFHHYHFPSNGVKAISIERLEQWSFWCKKGYSAQDIEQAIRPCYAKKTEELYNVNLDYQPISYQQSRQIKNYCTQQLWEKIH